MRFGSNTRDGGAQENGYIPGEPRRRLSGFRVLFQDVVGPLPLATPAVAIFSGSALSVNTWPLTVTHPHGP